MFAEVAKFVVAVVLLGVNPAGAQSAQGKVGPTFLAGITERDGVPLFESLSAPATADGTGYRVSVDGKGTGQSLSAGAVHAFSPPVSEFWLLGPGFYACEPWKDDEIPEIVSRPLPYTLSISVARGSKVCVSVSVSVPESAEFRACDAGQAPRADCAAGSGAVDPESPERKPPADARKQSGVGVK